MFALWPVSEAATLVRVDSDSDRAVQDGATGLGRLTVRLRAQARECRRTGDVPGHVAALRDLALRVHLRGGELTTADAVLEEALALCHTAGLAAQAASVCNGLAYLHNLQGRPDEALMRCGGALAVGVDLRLRAICSFAWMNRAWALSATGAQEQARVACASALSLLSPAYSDPLRPHALLVLAALRRESCLLAAVHTAKDALSAARQHRDAWTVGRCLLHVAELSLDAGLRDPARLAVAESELVFRRYDDGFHLAQWHLLAGRLAAARSDRAAAERHATTVLRSVGGFPLARPAATALAELLGSIVLHDRGTVHGLTQETVRAQDGFTPVAEVLLRHPHEVVRSWTVTVLAAAGAPWSWSLLNGHTDTSSVVNRMIEGAMHEANAAPLPDLEILCLGGRYTLRQGGKIVPESRWNSLHAKLILAYLALHGSATRDELIELLWPGDDPDKAGTRLHSTVRLLRRSLCPVWRTKADYVPHQGDRYTLAPGTRVTSDVSRFRDHVFRARHSEGLSRRLSCQQAVQHYGGEFLSGWHQDWVSHQRHQLSSDWLWAVKHHVEALLDQREFLEAERLAATMIAAAPLRESGWQMLMEALTGQDRTSEAVAAYAALARHLHAELDVAPSATSTRCVHELRRGLPTEAARERLADIRQSTAGT